MKIYEHIKYVIVIFLFEMFNNIIKYNHKLFYKVMLYNTFLIKYIINYLKLIIFMQIISKF